MSASEANATLGYLTPTALKNRNQNRDHASILALSIAEWRGNIHNTPIGTIHTLPRLPVMANSFGARSTLSVGKASYTFFSLKAVEAVFPQAKNLPFSLKILLENLLRNENGLSVSKRDIEALAKWNPTAEPDTEIAFTPARVLLQDFTGVPCIVDLAAMREGIKALGGDPSKINPLVPCELVIDHSVQVDESGTSQAFANNTKLEYERNQERYTFLRWGQNAFRNFKVVPPETGIVHQVNLEYLARVTFTDDSGVAYPDTLVGTDSHTTMVNGLGVLGWGVGGIEAEAAMLGQPVSMLIPQVIGFKLFGKLRQGVTATDLVLTVTQMLRKKGVVGKFVEFYGDGLADLPLADRATIANMAPEYGATCGIFPIDIETLNYLHTTGRPIEQIELVEAYCKNKASSIASVSLEAHYTDTLQLDLATVEPSLAGPRAGASGRSPLTEVRQSFRSVAQARDGREAQGHSARCCRTALCNSTERCGESRRWFCGHCGDYQLHEHLEPQRDGCCGYSRPESRSTRIDHKTVGENEPGTRF